MYRALYAFNTKDEGALNFKENDVFTVLESSDSHWFLVQNGYGAVGYVPGNYLKLDEEYGHTEVLKSIDRAIEAIHLAATCNSGNYTPLQRSNLQKLLQHRKNTVETYRLQTKAAGSVRRQAPRAPSSPDSASISSARSSTGSVSSNRDSSGGESPRDHGGGEKNRQVVRRKSTKKMAAPPPPVPVTGARPSQATTDNSSSSSEVTTPSNSNVTTPSNNDVTSTNSSDRAAPGTSNAMAHAIPDVIPSDVTEPDPMPPPRRRAPLQQTDVTDHRDSTKHSDATQQHSDVTQQHSDVTQLHSDVTVSQPDKHSLSLPVSRGAPTLPPQRTISQVTLQIEVPTDIGIRLIEDVRQETGLSYEASRVAVATVLTQLREHLPALAGVMDDVTKSLHITSTQLSPLAGSRDAHRLEELFTELAACKDDSQQRSWHLHEDEAHICDHLQELIGILTDANQEVCREVIPKENYESIHNLVLYYQMETRLSIRLLLLHVFGALCSLDARVISELLNSVLPLELARDIQTSPENDKKTSFSALVLTMIFSMGESIPVPHYEHLNRQFLSFLLSRVEDETEDSPDVFVNVLLAFNLHLAMPAENMLLDLLAEEGTAKSFTERVLLLFNRGEDPVRMFEHSPRPPDSVLKLMTDLYSRDDTCLLLYTNDAMVLMDIVIRHLADLSPGDKSRTEYLSLLQLILTHTELGQEGYRRADLRACLSRIAQEDGELSPGEARVQASMDKAIIQEIHRTCPDLCG